MSTNTTGRVTHLTPNHAMEGDTPVEPISTKIAFRILPTIGIVASLAIFTSSGPVQAGTLLSEAAKIITSDGAGGDTFGISVALDGDTAVIGSRWDDDNGFNSGSAYIFTRGPLGFWRRQAKLLASDGVEKDVFGFSVAISGDTAIVGAIDDDDNGLESGSAYIFVRDMNGVWTQEAKLLPSDGAIFDQFGFSVAISRDTAVIGMRWDDDNGSNSGSAYIFTRGPLGFWNQQAKLLPADGAIKDEFGFAVSLSGDTALIGANRDDDDGMDSGSAYIFERDASGAWTQKTKLLPADGAPSTFFGGSVALNGRTAVVGGRASEFTCHGDTGCNADSAYVFVRDINGAWGQQAKLLPSDGTIGDEFGNSVAISGDTVVVGARLDDDKGMNSGSAYVFTRTANGVWMQQAKLLSSDSDTLDWFGFSVAVSDVAALAGAPSSDGNELVSGSAYAFDLPLGSTIDLNGDGVVNGIDLMILITSWGGAGFADFNNNGIVDSADLAILLTNWS